MNVVGDYNYQLVMDPTPRGLVIRINAMLGSGWFSVGGISFDGVNYLQAMGIKNEDVKTTDTGTN